VKGGCLCFGGVDSCKDLAVGENRGGRGIHEEGSGCESVVAGSFRFGGNVIVEVVGLEVVPTNVFKSRKKGKIMSVALSRMYFVTLHWL
jgi:hypothetical protein